MFEPWLKRWAFIDDDTLAAARSAAGRQTRGFNAKYLSRLRVYGRVGIANVLHAMVAMSSIAHWIRSVIWLHQPKHRKCSGSWMIDHKQGIAADRES
ncbi:hypothetical protein VD17_19095 [Pseudomonas fluorescens]|uniref:Uncharacterized protein n=1 Tax=Pseudomonas fluorescens TaxID=294 RepID=A0A0F4V8E1_PSEFL|nr:hypothetical protein VD17_19095 [Pseudomonas fluorescens]